MSVSTEAFFRTERPDVFVRLTDKTEWSKNKDDGVLEYSGPADDSKVYMLSYADLYMLNQERLAKFDQIILPYTREKMSPAERAELDSLESGSKAYKRAVRLYTEKYIGKNRSTKSVNEFSPGAIVAPPDFFKQLALAELTTAEREHVARFEPLSRSWLGALEKFRNENAEIPTTLPQLAPLILQ